MTATRTHDSTAPQTVLYMALELSENTWKLAFTTGLGQEPRLRDIPARAVVVLEAEILAAKERFGLPPQATVVSCYEAGRDGFWLHRCLLARDQESPADWGDCRPNGQPLSQRQRESRAGNQQGGQPADEGDGDRDRLGLAALSAAERVESLVRAAFRARRQAYAAGGHRGLGAEAAGGLVEIPGDWNASGGRRVERLEEQTALYVGADVTAPTCSRHKRSWRSLSK